MWQKYCRSSLRIPTYSLVLVEDRNSSFHQSILFLPKYYLFNVLPLKKMIAKVFLPWDYQICSRNEGGVGRDLGETNFLTGRQPSQVPQLAFGSECVGEPGQADPHYCCTSLHLYSNSNSNILIFEIAGEKGQTMQPMWIWTFQQEIWRDIWNFQLFCSFAPRRSIVMCRQLKN